MEDLLVYYENEHEYSFDFDPVAIAKDVINEALSIHNVNIDSLVPEPNVNGKSHMP